MRLIYLLLAFTLILSACKKSEIDQLPVDNGSADTIVSEVIINNYIDRTYRLALGRVASSVEFDEAKTLLTNSNLDSTSRATFINTIFLSPDFRKHLYDEERIKMLGDSDSTEFINWAYIFQLLLQDQGHQNQWPYYQYEYDRMVLMKNAYSSFINDSIGIEELQRRMCDNYVYDLREPGTANFVLSTFMNLINRNPTATEEQSSINMVNGTSSILFLQQGTDKTDYLKIFISSNEFYKGQVELVYLKYLNRVPGTAELAEGTSTYFSTKDFVSVHRIILTSKEFAGL